MAQTRQQNTDAARERRDFWRKWAIAKIDHRVHLAMHRCSRDKWLSPDRAMAMFRAFAKSAHGGRLDVGLTTYLRDSRWWMDEVHAVGMLRGEAPFFDRVSPAQHKRGLVADRQSYDLFLAAITGDKLGKLKVPVQLLIFNLRLGQKGKWTRLKS